VLDALSDPELACHTLVERANDAGGRDNITVVIAAFE
jgi:serine/threonine protein phosphatase PrpC